MFTSPNFQFVRSIVRVYGPSNGIRDFRYPATASKSSTICARKRRKLDSLETLLSNAAANLDKQTVCMVQSAPSSMERHLMWARFKVDLNIGRITEKISLLLCETLVFRNMVLMWRLKYLKLRKIEVLPKHNCLKFNKLRQYSKILSCTK